MSEIEQRSTWSAKGQTCSPIVSSTTILIRLAFRQVTQSTKFQRTLSKASVSQYHLMVPLLLPVAVMVMSSCGALTWRKRARLRSQIASSLVSHSTNPGRSLQLLTNYTRYNCWAWKTVFNKLANSKAIQMLLARAYSASQTGWFQ